MEFVLNLVWLLAAAIMLRVWIGQSPSRGASRRLQFVALAVALVVLFPVISVTDDLQTVQASAETEGSNRRVHAAGHPDEAPLVAAPPLPMLDAALPLEPVAAIAPLPIEIAPQAPAPPSLLNRPPPTA